MISSTLNLNKLSLWSSVLFLAILLSLHFIKPEVDPSWQMVSEYEIGKYGWMMRLAFLILGFSYITLFFAIKSTIKTSAGRFGLALLLLSGAGALMGGLFITDPILTDKAQMTFHAKMHGLGFLLGVPGFPIAATLISLVLAHNKTKTYSRKRLFFATVFTWLGLGLAILFTTLLLPKGGGKFNSDVKVGWPNRFLIISYASWIIIIAIEGIRLYTCFNKKDLKKH